MTERRGAPRALTFRNGKILFDQRGSAIDCMVRNLSETGALVQVESAAGIPHRFELSLGDESEPQQCNLVWRIDNRIGVSFAGARAQADGPDKAQCGATSMLSSRQRNSHESAGNDLVRAELLRLRAALDEVPFGVVLLDNELRAQFINRSFRKIWRLPDAKADSKPAFVALMYHGRDTRAYGVPAGDVDAYIAARVAHVKAGDPDPLDLRMANGEVLRFQCTVLPAGGRMLSYTPVTDIVRHAGELDVLRAALDQVRQGVVLLDADLRIRFMNGAVRSMWRISEDEVSRRPSFAELVRSSRERGIYEIPDDQVEEMIARRIAVVRTGDPTPADLRIGGRVVRAQCCVLPAGGRMLTYYDVSDLVQHAELLENFATLDSLTSLFNRRHFLTLAESEWSRFQRYHRPLSLLMLDVDKFKGINDQFGHHIGDEALVHIATLCREDRRGSDAVARIGGEEFAVLLPETDLAQATVTAERLRQRIADQPLRIDGTAIALTVSIGAAQARLGMPSIHALIRTADGALYEAKQTGRNRVVGAADARLEEFDHAAE